MKRSEREAQERLRKLGVHVTKRGGDPFPEWERQNETHRGAKVIMDSVTTLFGRKAR